VEPIRQQADGPSDRHDGELDDRGYGEAGGRDLEGTKAPS
jgi:hypothetical protein